jgi:hypothetical protein
MVVMHVKPLQAVPEGASSGRRSKKGQADVDAWQPADGAKRNVRLQCTVKVCQSHVQWHDTGGTQSAR